MGYTDTLKPVQRLMGTCNYRIPSKSLCYQSFSNKVHFQILLILELSGGPLTKKYKFEQFHFHWGGNDSEGSEHRVDGKMYPAEVGAIHEILNPILNLQSNRHSVSDGEEPTFSYPGGKTLQDRIVNDLQRNCKGDVICFL